MIKIVHKLFLVVILSLYAGTTLASSTSVSLRSNKNAAYYVNGKKVGIGKNFEITLPNNKSHKISARAPGYKEKSEYIQANYPRNRLGFIFLSDDKLASEEIDYDPAANNVKRVNIKPYKPGRHIALIIANSDYNDSTKTWSSLNSPSSDARKLKTLLEKNYGFTDTIFIEDATRSDVYNAFRKLIKTVKNNDSVLVFYAGHGYFDNNEIKTGYWIPTDATGKDESTFVSNEDIKKRLSLLARKTNHVLLISDSCFSGNFLSRGLKKKPGKITDQYFTRKSRLKSSQVISSGGNEYVDDSYSDSGHSPFAYFLLRKLQNNDQQYLSTTELSLHLEKTISNAVNQTPRHGTLKQSEDEGGEFFFIRKK